MCIRDRFGRETKAVALATRKTAHFTVNLSTKGAEAAQRLIERQRGDAADPETEDGDASFPAEEAAENASEPRKAGDAG